MHLGLQAYGDADTVVDASEPAIAIVEREQGSAGILSDTPCGPGSRIQSLFYHPVGWRRDGVR